MKPQKCLSGILVTILVVQFAVVKGNEPAQTCDSDNCAIDNNCRCSSASSPLDGDLSEWPQLISLTFDEAVTEDIYVDTWAPLLLDDSRTNPDGNPIGATFFVPHEYTNYKRVNDLYNYGFEIGVHSVTKNPLQSYWRHASEETLVQEFQGQKHIIAKFANIPEDAIQGVRTPQLQLSGNNSIQAYITSGLSYDSSWPSLPGSRLFPYTLDYLSTEQCLLGAKCPNEAFAGFWILPINELTGKDGKECNTIASCGIEGTAEEIANWLTEEIEKVRTTSKTPMSLLINSYWFNFTANSLDGLKLFFENMKEKDDVFLVSQKQVLEFIKSPTKTVDFKTDDVPDGATCNHQSCQLKKGNDDRNMDACISCPDVYPWLGNPDGTNTHNEILKNGAMANN